MDGRRSEVEMTRRHRERFGHCGLKTTVYPSDECRAVRRPLCAGAACGDSSCRVRFEKDGEVPVVVSGEGKSCS